MSPARRAAALAVALAFTASSPALAAGGAATRGTPSGGAGFSPGALAPTQTHPKVPLPPAKNAHGTWLRGVTITEYWPAPESWFAAGWSARPGCRASTGSTGCTRPTGVSMEGEGIGLDGRMYHIDSLGRRRLGHRRPASSTVAVRRLRRRRAVLAGRRLLARTAAAPLRSRSSRRLVGRHRRTLCTAAGGDASRPGPSLPLHFYQSIAVDPGVIPLGSRVYIPAYRHDGHGGWFVAQDTGGAINGHRIDVYRPPPPSPNDGGEYLTCQRVFVIKPQAS